MHPPLPIHFDLRSGPTVVRFALNGDAPDFAHPHPGGATFKRTYFGAHRITGGSSRKNRIPGDFDPTIPVRD